MGKWIDRAAILVSCSALLYILFLSAFGNITIACCLSFICCALLIRLRKREKYRMTKPQAQVILENWAYGDDSVAQSQIEALLHFSFGKLIYLPRHPSAVISIGDIFSAWKNHQNADRIFIAAVCASDGRARSFAATLRSPSVEILDAARLIPLVRQSDLPAPEAFQFRHFFRRLRFLMADLPTRRPWQRRLAAGLGLMLIYLVTGNAAYLALSIASLFIAGVGIRVRT